MASERVRDTLTELYDLTLTELYDLGREDGLRDAAAEIARLTSELEAARSHARRLCVALRAIRDEAAIGGPPLESRRKDWEAAMDEADEVLGELEALYGE